MRARPPTLLALAAAACACRAASPSVPAGPGPRMQAEPPPVAALPAIPPPAAVPAPALALPGDWAEMPRLAFERGIEAWIPAGARRGVPAETLAALELALSGADETALRAAVLLGRCGAPGAAQALLRRLEARRDRPSGADRAVDIVAAAALGAAASGAEGTDEGERLEALATGPRPHPDALVRVECAVSALGLGRDGVAAFLLAVLRARTRAESLPPLFDEETDVALQQARAARALAGRAGTEPRFRPDAPPAEREAEAERLERLLRPGG